MEKQDKGITLVALVITIIILLILAGITVGFVFGENGIINMAKSAGKNYVDAEKQESETLNELYSSMLIATNEDSQITIKVEDLKKLIEDQVNEKTRNLENKVEELTNKVNNIEPMKYIDPSRKIMDLSMNTLYTVEEDCIFTGFVNMKGGAGIGLWVDGIQIGAQYYNGTANVGGFFPAVYLKKGSTIKLSAGNPSLFHEDSKLQLFGLK